MIDEAIALLKEAITLTGYHGTQDTIDEFRLPAWFSNTHEHADMFSADWGHTGGRSDDSKVYTVELTFDNPYYTEDWSVTEPHDAKKMMNDLIAQGYDSVIFTSPDDPGEREYIAFKSSQIKFRD